MCMLFFFVEKFGMGKFFHIFGGFKTRPRQVGSPFKADGYQSSDGAHPLPKGHLYHHYNHIHLTVANDY